MNSLPTIDQVNQDNFGNVVRKMDPELYLIHIALQETKVNPLIIPKVIRALSNMAVGSGYGKIMIFMERKTVTSINGEERVNVGERVVNENT
jgi:hypothetical protein